MMDLLANTVFMQPAILAALLALPLLWYILRITPPAPKIVHFPATRFLAGLISDEHTPSHTPWWILLLRLLIAALIIVALARPVYNPADTLPGSGPVRLVLDNGWASAQVWDMQQKAAEEILSQAARENRDIYILTTAPAPGEKEPQHFGPLAYAEAVSILRGLAPLPWPADNKALTQWIKDNKIGDSVASIWLSHGLEEGRLGGLAQTLQAQGSLQFVSPAPTHMPVLLRPADKAADQSKTPGSDDIRIAIDTPRNIPDNLPVTVQALDGKGNILDIQTAALHPSKLPQTVLFDIPPTARNMIASFRVSGRKSAGAVFLLDEQFRKRDVGIVGPPEKTETAPLVGAPYYLKRALEPFATLSVDEPDALLAKNPAVMILPDIGAMPADTLNRLEQWVKDGGLLIRFSGPHMSEAQGLPYLVPVRLRAGERALSGSLSWDTPQKIAPFPESSPFYGLDIPEDVTVRQQILADPAQDLDGKIWAALADGTPLITGAPLEKGLVALVHTTADPQWSDLALSGLYVNILKRFVGLAGHSANQINTGHAWLDPLLTLDGRGEIIAPPAYARSIPSKDAASFPPDSGHPPGIYGHSGFQYALNLGATLPALKAAGDMPSSIGQSHYEAEYELSLTPRLLLAALILFLADWAIMIALISGIMDTFQRAPRIAAVTILLTLTFLPAPARADATSDEKFANGFYLAYIRTGDNAIDATTRAGLEHLSETLRTRTSVEPDGVAEVNPETDTLIFFPLLYWTIGPNQQALSDKALGNLQFYLDHGGTILFDTRDQYAPNENYAVTPNARILRQITATLDIPPLGPIPKDHVLGKSFYLLKSYPGRFDGGTLWIEKNSASGRDGVSSVIVGGHDWAGSWAESLGNGGSQVMRLPVGRTADRHEMALRFGVNLVMYTLTGNYKADQVHLPLILKRLDR